ncbi:MAG: hypothetical protein Fur0010_12530 [Bdellovibrio sp.]
MDLERVKKQLDGISPTMCAAKWLQVTLHLQNGTTHSCHHPTPHRISLSELRNNPAALHNTSGKIKNRKLMLQGKRPKECEYCWKVEDDAPSVMSDRIKKSAMSWSNQDFIDLKYNYQNPKPTYLEVSFGRQCNLACAYCSEDYSTSIAKEIKKFGPYFKLHGLKKIIKSFQNKFDDRDENPYVEAFWKWFPDIRGGLKVLRVTGGEPILNPNTLKLMKFLLAEKCEDLNFSINSNLSVREQLWESFFQEYKKFTPGENIKELEFFASIDTWGESATYIRHGMNLDWFRKRIIKILKETKANVILMCTFNVLSFIEFPALLDWISQLKQEFGARRVLLDISRLRYPEYLSPLILERSHSEKLRAEFERMKDLGFDPMERSRLLAIIELIENKKDGDYWKSKKETLKQFLNEYDRRKKLDHTKIFGQI